MQSQRSGVINPWMLAAVAVIGMVGASFLPWMTADSDYGSESASLAETIQQLGLPSDWSFWVTVLGIAGTIVVTFIAGPNRKVAAVVSSLMMAAFPVGYIVDYFRIGMNDWGLAIGVGCYVALGVAVVTFLMALAVETIPFHAPMTQSGYQGMGLSPNPALSTPSSARSSGATSRPAGPAPAKWDWGSTPSVEESSDQGQTLSTNSQTAAQPASDDNQDWSAARSQRRWDTTDSPSNAGGPAGDSIPSDRER